jgi:hypothetical protein
MRLFRRIEPRRACRKIALAGIAADGYVAIANSALSLERTLCIG